MDAAEALADLVEISSQVDAAVMLGEDGRPQASAPSPGGADALARAAHELLAAAAGVAAGSGDRVVTRLQAATRAGSLFVLSDGDRTIAATTGRSPTVGLVFYDLRTALARLDDPAPADPGTGPGAGADG